MSSQRFDRSARYSSLPTDVFFRIDTACSQFEAALRAGENPHIEDWLNRVAPDHRQVLFEGLLDLDLNVNPRWTPEQRPDEASYRQRFPEYVAAIARAFRELCGEVVDSQDRPSDAICHESSSMPPSSDPVPRLPEHLEIQRTLGHGYFGIVYLAYDKRLERRVAVKVLRQNWQQDPEVRARFWQEARIAADFRHPNLVAIYELPELPNDQGHAIVMEFLDGGTLHDLVQSWANGSTDFDELLAIMEQVAQAVHFVHTSNISKGPLVHRDLKPANIILDNHRQPRVVDFGLAAWTARLAQGQEVAGGTRAYMSPEQVRHFRERQVQVDPRSDIWSLGVILYEILTGRLPFRGSPDEIMDAIEDRRRTCAGPRKANPDIHLPLDKIVRRCLSNSPKHRFQSAGELAKAIRDYRKTRIATAKWICARFRYEMDEETPLKLVVAERIRAAQWVLAASLIRMLGLRREFPPKDLVRQMLEARRYPDAFKSMRMLHITSGPLVENTVRQLIEADKHKVAVQWIQTFDFRNWPLVEQTVLRLIEAAAYKTAVRWMKKFKLAHLVSLQDLVTRMIAAAKYGDAIEAVRLFDLRDAFPPEDFVRKMIEAKQYRDVAKVVDQLHLVEKLSIEDRVLLIRGMIEAGQRRDARRFANRFGVAEKFLPGSFWKRKI
jgi:serine/threonine protein kinase